MSAKTERLKTPLLFPCAARVTMPQLGSEDSDLKEGLKSGRYAPDTIVFKSSGNLEGPVGKDYLKKVATGLSFEEDVVRERCYHALPYDEKYMFEAFDISDLVPLPPRTSVPVGRHNARIDVRHMPCNLTKLNKSHLKPLKRRITLRAQQMHQEALKREELRESVKKLPIEGLQRGDSDDRTTTEEPVESVFLTETTTDKEPEPKEEEKQVKEVQASASKRGNDWDAYLMSIISSNTANWIVYERTPAGSQDREKLEGLLKKWYGEPEHTDLVREDTSDNELDTSQEEDKKPQKKWKKKEANLLERVYNLKEEIEPEAVDPYSDDNKAPFYRQPAGLRRAKKHTEKEELVRSMKGAINTTAANITVKPFKPPPPPTLRDFMNPDVGDYIFETHDMFQQEQLTGTSQLFDPFGDKSKIVLESNNKYKRQLQTGFPKPPEHWFPETDAEKDIQQKNRKQRKKFERGHKRWKDLPESIDDTGELLKVLPPGADSDFQRSADHRTRKTAKSNASLMQIIDEWRTKWHLSGQYTDSTPDDLIKDMADIQPHVRLKAIATCAKAADYKPPTDHGIHLEFMGKTQEDESLPEKLFVALECLLDDPVIKVQKAAAITLYSLNRPLKKAEGILYEALQGENPVDRWAAAQCLAHYGVCDSDVVGEILKQVMTTEDTIKHERGISMLGILSVTSRLVHSMVAEQLNSSSWRHKVIACKILPTLRGDINRDIVNKLSDLMWNDWHAEVRRAAAQCLGKTGHGRDVHDDLCKCITATDERLKLDAISKIGQLGIMTAKLLPSFLQCFEDEYVAVRSEACITCGNLAIKDEEIIAKLIQLATFDNIWKVKALAFQALGKIGLITEQIVDCLLWAVRYEENPGVRAEACHTLKVLEVKTEEVADVIQDRYLVESNPMVREELTSTLKMFDISASEDMDMVAQVKKEVKKLCTRNIIARQIEMNEQDEDRRQNLARMIYKSEKDMKEHEKELPPVMERIRSMSQASDHAVVEDTRKVTMNLEQEHDGEHGGERDGETEHEAEPHPDRETQFTPTADQELEAILGKDEAKSGRSSPADTKSTPGTKSRATSATSTSGSSGKADDEETDTEDDDETNDTEGSEKQGSEPAQQSCEPPSSGNGSQTPGKDTDDGTEGEVARITDPERPSSMVKFASHLEVADIPSQSMSSLGPSRLSLMDDMGKPSRTSQTTGTTATDMVFGRDAVLEREKVNEEARNTFAIMDLRYQDMVEDLIELDNAFELGLIDGDRKLFEKRISSVKITKTPPSTAGGKSDILVTVGKEDAGKDKSDTTATHTDDTSMVKSDGANNDNAEENISTDVPNEAESNTKSNTDVTADDSQKADVKIVITDTEPVSDSKEK